MGFVRKTTGIDLTGGGARSEASKAAKQQIAAQEEGVGVLREDLAPFREVGQEAAQQLLSSVFTPVNQDPQAVLQNPFFRALADEQERNILSQRAALGLAGSGGTQDALQRNLLLLGNEFQQQDINNAIQQNQLRFNQLLGASQLGQSSAAQSGAASLNTMSNIGQLRGVGGLVGAQVAGQQGQQLLQGAGMLASAFGGGLLGGGAGAVGAGVPVGQQVFGAGGTGALSTFGL